MKIVTATHSDYDFAKTVHHEAYKDMVLRQYGAWEDEAQDGFFERAWKRLPHSIIWYGGTPCGYCCVEEDETSLQLREFAISPSKQNQGIGTEFLRNLINDGKNRGLTVKLNVMKTNDDAKRFYKRMGFAVEGDTETHYLMTFSDSHKSAQAIP